MRKHSDIYFHKHKNVLLNRSINVSINTDDQGENNIGLLLSNIHEIYYW